MNWSVSYGSSHLMLEYRHRVNIQGGINVVVDGGVGVGGDGQSLMFLGISFYCV